MVQFLLGPSFSKDINKITKQNRIYTLVYLNGSLNRLDTLPPFLQANVGKSPLIWIDCVTPFQGTAEELAEKVCGHLSAIDPQVDVKFQEIKNANMELPKQDNRFILWCFK